METNQTITDMLNRKSCRAYTSEPVSEDELEAVVEAGLYAANGRGAQSASLVVVTNKAVRNGLSKLNAAVLGPDNTSDPFYGAPIVIAVLADSTSHTFVEDGSLVIGNMLLAASSLGLGACWVHRAREVFETSDGRKLRSEWGLPDSYEGVGFCILGHPAADGKSYERKANRIIRIK